MSTTKNIQSIERAFAILELFQQTGRAEASVKEISVALDMNKSTTFGLINTLTNLGYLQQNADNSKYALGLKLLNFSNTVKVQNIIIRTVHPYLEQISRKYCETVHCAVQYADSVIYVDKVEATGSIFISTQVGTRNDLHCTGVGKCILAYLPQEVQERVYAGSLKTMTYNTITNSEQLRQEVQRVREVGYATDNEEISLGLTCLAVPVFSGPGKVGCAISVSGMTSRIRHAKENGLVDELKRAAVDISLNTFGYACAAPESGAVLAAPGNHD